MEKNGPRNREVCHRRRQGEATEGVRLVFLFTTAQGAGGVAELDPLAGAEPFRLLSTHTPSPNAKSDKWVQIQQSVIWRSRSWLYEVRWKSFFGSNPVTLVLTMDFVRHKHMG